MNHRYLRKVDYSRHISLQKPTSTTVTISSLHIEKTRQAGQVNEQATKIKQAGWVNVLALSGNILAAATNRTKIEIQDSYMCN